MKFIGEHLENSKGLTLIEILVASVILSFTILAFGYIFALGEGMIDSQAKRRAALTLARESMERIQGQPKGTATVFSWLRGDFDYPDTEYGWSKSGNVWTNDSADENSVGNSFRRDISAWYVNDTGVTLDTEVSTSSTLRLTVTVSSTQSEFQPVVLSKTFTKY